MRALLVILVLSVLGVGVDLAPAQEGSVRFERWYRVMLDGRPIGWQSYREWVEGGEIVTEAVYVERVLVLGEARDYERRGVVVEAPGGRVIAKRVFVNGRRVAIGETGGEDGDDSSGFDDALGPSATARFLAQRLMAGAARARARVVNPLGLSRVDELELTSIAPCSLVIGARQVDGYGAREGGDDQAGASVMLCERGYPIRYTFREGAGAYEIRAASREEATAAFEPVERGGQPVRVVVRENADVWREGRRFMVWLASGDAMANPGQIGDFRYEARDVGLLVSREPGDPAELSADERAAALRETRLLNFSSIDAPTLRGTLDTGERARLLEAMVRARISRKGYGVRLGDARRAWEDRVGDCTEHAALLCALLRREGVPARVVGGLAMVGPDEGVMRQHLWVQALIDAPDGSRWVDLDASVPEGAANHRRLALGATGVTDETVEDLVRRLGAMDGLLRVVALEPE